MMLREEILLEHSKAQCNKIIEWVGDSQKHFDELVRLFFSGEYRVVQRAAWPLSYCAIAHPELAKKHLPKMVENLANPQLHDAVKRNTLRLLQFVPVPPLLQGTLMDTCFNYIASPADAAAIKAFSLTVLYNLSKTYPEIKTELRLQIEERWDHESSAFKSRAKKILREMDQQRNSRGGSSKDADLKQDVF